jgi:hypothetical protein
LSKIKAGSMVVLIIGVLLVAKRFWLYQIKKEPWLWVPQPSRQTTTKYFFRVHCKKNYKKGAQIPSACKAYYIS